MKQMEKEGTDHYHPFGNCLNRDAAENFTFLFSPQSFRARENR